MNAEDVANFMADDEAELPPNPHYNDKTAPPPRAAAAPVARPVPRAPPGQVRPPPTAPPVLARPPAQKEEEEVSPEDIRNMLMRADEEEAAGPGRKSPRRFEPLASGIEGTAGRRGAAGGGFASVVVVGTEERAETMEEQARTFVAYRLEVRRDEGGPFIIYRRYKQFETLWSRCRSHGMAVTDLPPRRRGNWFGLRPVDPEVVAERVPRLQEWFEHALSLPQAASCKYLQEWLSPVQLGDLSAKNYAKLMEK